MKRVLCSVFAVAAVSACGGQMSGSLPDAGGGDSGSPGPSAVCPASLPAESTSCAHEGAECEYGSNSDYQCNTLAVCQGGVWLYDKGSPPGACSTGLGPDCAPSASQVPTGQACGTLYERCNYPDRVCECGYPSGPAMQKPIWVCESPAGGCPIPRPKLGSACSVSPDLSCDYGSCSLTGGVVLTCQNGVWAPATMACPL